jgi:RNase adaptor protein for sRNA GlmZ degradation
MPFPLVHRMSFQSSCVAVLIHSKSENAGGNTHFLFGDTKIPDAPHLIVVPSQLVPFWEGQIKQVLGKNADVFPYLGTYDSHKDFFKPKGAYNASKLPKYKRIILATTTVGCPTGLW